MNLDYHSLSQSVKHERGLSEDNYFVEEPKNDQFCWNCAHPSVNPAMPLIIIYDYEDFLGLIKVK